MAYLYTLSSSLHDFATKMDKISFVKVNDTRGAVSTLRMAAQFLINQWWLFLAAMYSFNFILPSFKARGVMGSIDPSIQSSFALKTR